MISIYVLTKVSVAKTSHNSQEGVEESVLAKTFVKVLYNLSSFRFLVLWLLGSNLVICNCNLISKLKTEYNNSVEVEPGREGHLKPKL